MAAQTLDHPICAKHRDVMHDQTPVFNSDKNLAVVLEEVESVPTEFENILTSLAARSDVSGKGGSKSMWKLLGAAAGSTYDESRVKKLRARLDEIEKRAMRFTILSLWLVHWQFSYVAISMLTCPGSKRKRVPQELNISAR